MTPALTFFFGLAILALFAWYFASDSSARKRNIGLVLTILLVAFCLQQIIPPDKTLRLGLDLRGGTSFLIRLLPGADQEITPDMLDQAVEVIRKRVDQYGVNEPVITPQGQDRILVQIAGLDADQIDTAREQLQRVAKLEFSIVPPNGAQILADMEAGRGILPPQFAVKEYKVNPEDEVAIPILVNKKPDLTGDTVHSAFAFYDQRGWGVVLNFNSEGADRFDALARQNKGNQLAIILDGEIQSAPTLQSDYYGGRAEITGHFTEAEARNLASVLENPLRVPVVIDETRSVSSTLGSDSIRSGLMAGAIGLVVVLIFLMIYYHLIGLIALVGLAVNIILLFGMMAMFSFTLTLPGIAGIILTIGMAVDANVLIYERLREELATGKSLRAAVSGAYDKAFSAIFDANVTTLITSVILMWQAVGSVRGFAVTLTLGIIASMFSALLVTHTIFRWMLDKGGLSKISMLNVIPKKAFDFVGKRKLALLVSLILLVGSVTVIGLRGENNYGIDFLGGDLVVLDFDAPPDLAEARSSLVAGGHDDVVLQFSREGDHEVLSIRSPQGSSDGIVESLQGSFPSSGLKVVRNETVGAQIGGEFLTRSCIALALGMLGILIYTTLRFEFGFALGAVVAVLHDVVITLGIFSLVGGQLSLVMVGAVLTIAGYSINDTIVIFDRIREGLHSGARGSILEIINSSINETLGRTILTGGTTLLSIAALYFLGGAVLRDFSFAIFAGIIIGTYSSIFVAPPVVLWWAKVQKKNLRREVIDTQASGV
ncbi:MAG: protein translocase subunit SecD [Chthoniobacterales bacterium]